MGLCIALRWKEPGEEGWLDPSPSSYKVPKAWLGIQGPQVPKGIPPVLQDKPSAHLEQAKKPPPAHPTQRTMVTLNFAPLPHSLFPRCSLCSQGGSPSSAPALGSHPSLQAPGSLPSPHWHLHALLGPITLSCLLS